MADGRRGTDSTPLIDWFEREHPGHAIVPADPQLAYLPNRVANGQAWWSTRATAPERNSPRTGYAMVKRIPR